VNPSDGPKCTNGSRWKILNNPPTYHEERRLGAATFWRDAQFTLYPSQNAGYLVPGTHIALYIRPFAAINPIALIRSFGDTNGREALPAGE
jgi:hypothetical protein